MNQLAPTLWQRIRYTRLSDALRGRFDASLDWQMVVANADLPTELTEVVTGTVRATGLWQAERVDVARELVAHFHDGLDAGRTPEQLIESFGDSKQTARLIRRAQKRG